MHRRTILILTGAGVIVALPLAAFSFLAFRSGDAPAPASLSASPDGAGPGDPSEVAGTWSVAEVDTNFVGYRARERLGPVAAPADAVGRTSEVTGEATIEGESLTALDLTVQMTSISSDSSGRDERVRGPILAVDEFPTAEFHLSDPVELDPPPRDRVVEVEVPGELTLRGETGAVVFEVQARWNGPTIQAAGTTEVMRTDYGVGVSGLAGFSVEETVTIEFELTFALEDAEVAGPPPTLVDNPLTPTDETAPPCIADGPAPELTSPILVSVGRDQGASFEVVTRGVPPTLMPVVGTPGLTGGAAWSRDGSQIVFSSSAAPDARRTLATAASTGGTVSPLPGLTDVLQPDWGPNGRIVFVQRGEDTSEIWVTDAAGSNPRLLVATPGEDSDPRWSPDGEEVMFTTVAGEDNQDVVIVDADGQGLRTVVGGPGYEYSPSFTERGTTVLFARDGNVYTIGIDGDGERQITEGGRDVNPEMSPDGSQLAFLRDGSLFVATNDALDEPVCVETRLGIGGGPRWQPQP